MTVARSVLEFENVAKTHRGASYDKPLLRDISLSLSAGDVVAVWGSPRSGKTTLLRLAAGLATPDKGTIRFGGVDLSTRSQSAVSALRLGDIGLARMDGPRTTELPVLHYVALAVMKSQGRGGALRRARSVLRWVGAADCANARWEHLSDSEKALISLAHGLVREPQLLLVDDVTARLDALQQADVIDALHRAASDRRVAVLVTCSALSAAVGAHESFTLSQGRLKQINDPARLGQVVRFPQRTSGGDA
ncbi:ATP-binding cassette domain-containing protein [Conexibacter sp. JD483]|uniref:ATP-binding cassette domain-containing protein n=1 Tax=unclassified Conexibacter TaxID=2627773 RepID=UPI00271A9184|nr:MULTISPECIES: ATP-binding cassette domain-containing protein [unclassified Conexibacter]MDO8187278.1 ATP-binding cassette domain-containing protein [Conexibacter sp. CPCC 205706]MDO8198887.1 ATP-binding cassette domain-containing protein [Conexibacter sp. CPCC 205762]MDR9370626.1 ATP-binding cassette domain-containing protein [Conexibacter sp. JD483]